MQKHISDIYLYLSYSKSAQHLAKLLGHFFGHISIHDGFQCTKFGENLNIAFVDELIKDSLLIKLAQNNVMLIGLSDQPLNPMVQNILSPLPTGDEIKTIFQSIENQQNINTEQSIDQLLPGKSSSWQYVKSIVQKSAETSCSVLLHGESGTGKELVAQAIHKLSDRSEHPFIAVNCGAIPHDLIESELFGHEKGSFTGAIASRIGKFEQAGQGTLFLDEIGDMPFSMQVKLLRVLQEKVFEKIGSNKQVAFNARIICATHQSLANLVQDQKFREDLFYRLNVLPITLPALRERVDDLEIIFQALKDKEQWKFNLSKSALKALKTLQWPGNIRQFYNLMSRAQVFHPEKTLKDKDIHELFECEKQGVKE